MTKHTTAMGKTIDMAALAAKHERMRAVGNMHVNARGDTIDNENRIINDNTKRVNETYMKTVRKNVPQAKSTNPAPIKVNTTELTPEEREFEDNDEDFKK